MHMNSLAPEGFYFIYTPAIQSRVGQWIPQINKQNKEKKIKIAV